MNLQLVEKDISLVNNQFQMVSGMDEMVQKVDNCLDSYLGDWFLNLPEGLPFFQEILQKGVTDDKIEAVFSEYIAAIEGVVTIESFEIITDPKTRKARINFRARTKDGVLDYSKTI